MKRRRFLNQSGIGLLAALSGRSLALPERRAGSVNIELIAERVSKSLVDGALVPIWQFRCIDSDFTPGVLPCSLKVTQGRAIHVTVTNRLDRAINFTIPGLLDNSQAVASGQSWVYSFTAATPGSYIFYDELNGDLSLAMGLAGPLIVQPKNGDESEFDKEYVLFFNELDDRVNDAINVKGNSPGHELEVYEPNYFFFNGLSYPETLRDPETVIQGKVGNNILIRFINAGLMANTMHFHGYHVKVLERNRIPETEIIDKDTVLVKSKECVDVMLTLDQPGMFPLHTHFLPGTTADGIYLNPVGGAVTRIRTA